MQEVKNREVRFDHLFRMTDCTGIIQHSTYSIPNKESGYTTDDNARALIVALKAHEHLGNPDMARLSEIYMGFLALAMNPSGKWRNFMSYTRNFIEDEGSEDCFGRAIMALGYACSSQPESGLGRLARALIGRAWPWIPRLISPRAQAFAIIGLYHLAEVEATSEVFKVIQTLSNSLTGLYRAVSGKEWAWFEESLTYCNGVFPEALFDAYWLLGKQRYLKVARASLGFLTDSMFRQGKLKVVGNNGWWHRGEAPADFDEQPVDAGQMVQAYLAGFRATREKEYFSLAHEAFEWFHGKNVLGHPIYDTLTGGCYDGLTPSGVNLNQGAESLLAYLLAYLWLLETEAEEGRLAG